MDGKQDAAPVWLFGIAGTAVAFTIMCMAHQAMTSKPPARPVSQRPTPRTEWPTLGPPPVLEAAAPVRQDPFLAPAKPAALDLVELTDTFSEPADTLVFPLVGLPGDEAYDPLAEIEPIDLLKPVEDPTATWQESATELAELVITPMDLRYGPSDIIVLAPTSPRWKSGSFTGRWSLFGVDTAALSKTVGQYLADTSNRAQVATADTAAAAQTLASRLAESADGGVIHSPPALAGPLVDSSDDRLAMAVSPEATASSSRSQADDDTTLPVEETESLATPTTLLEQVRLLMAEPATSMWAMQVEAALDGALAVRPGDAVGFARISRELRRLALEGSDLAELVDSQRAAVLLRRACYGIFRRLAAWDLTVKIEARRRDAYPVHLPIFQPDSVDAIAKKKWRLVAYHLAGRKRDLLGAAPTFATHRDLRVMNASQFTAIARQRRDSGVDAMRLVSRLEAYESGRSPRLAAAVADDLRTLRASEAPMEQQLADQIDRQYRNANFRVAVADELIRRLLPESTQEKSRLREQVLGADVRGVATTKTDLSVKLTPDETCWRVGIEARGRVATRTQSASGPVVLHSRGTTDFVAIKPVEVSRDGVTFSAARCEATNRTRLVGVDSSVGRVPVVRRVVESRARDEFRTSQAAVRRHAEQQVERRVNRSLDAQASEAVERLRHQYFDQVVGRADALGMEVEPLEVRTTDQRLIARLRLAADGQLGSHTPRTRAPSDSLASLQLHESAINNAAAGLELAGRRFTPNSLRAHLAERLRSPSLASGEIDAPKAELVFAANQPLSVRIGDGQARVVLAVAEMRLGGKRYHDFKVHASYEPEPVGAAAIVRRTGALEIEGRLKTASRLRLHGVFGKVLSDARPITLLAPPAGDQRFDNLMVTQMVLDDGWLGLAIGPADHPGIRGKRVAVAGRYLR